MYANPGYFVVYGSDQKTIIMGKYQLLYAYGDCLFAATNTDTVKPKKIKYRFCISPPYSPWFLSGVQTAEQN